MEVSQFHVGPKFSRSGTYLLSSIRLIMFCVRLEFVRKKPACIAEAVAKGDLFNVLGCGYVHNFIPDPTMFLILQYLHILTRILRTQRKLTYVL